MNYSLAMAMAIYNTYMYRYAVLRLFVLAICYIEQFGREIGTSEQANEGVKIALLNFLYEGERTCE